MRWIGWPLAALMGCQPAPATTADAEASPPMDLGVTPDASPPPPDAAPPADLGDPDAAPPAPSVPTDPAAELQPQAVYPDRVLALEVLPDGALLQTNAGVVWWAAEGAQALPSAAVTAAAQVGATRLMADGDGALWVLDLEGMTPSPLPVQGVVDLAAEGERLWISAASGLQVWQAGVLRPVGGIEPAELPLHALRAGRWGDASALWFLTAEGTPSALVVTGDQVQRWRMADAPSQAYALAASAEATWALADESLWRFDGQRWDRVPLGGRLAALAGHPAAADLWLGLVDGTVWHSRAGRYRPIRGLAPAGVLRADAEGALWTAGAQGVQRALLGRLVTLDGPPPGATLTEPAVVTLRPSDAAAVTEVVQRLDAGPWTPVEGPPWAVTVGPDAGPGRHELGVQVTWDDGATATAAWPFEVPRPPTWVADILPLFDAHCAGACHGDRGQARPLYEAQQWRDQIDQILDAVRQARMPLATDPLSPTAIDRIAAWQAAGMPEE